MKPAAIVEPLPPSKFTYHIHKGGNSTETVKRACEKLGWTQVSKPDPTQPLTANFVWKPDWGGKTQYEPPTSFTRENRNVLKRQVWNHFRAVEPLCVKDSLSATMLQYYQNVGLNSELRMPPTFLIEPSFMTESGGGQREWPGWNAFSAKFRECAADASLKNMWLCKPTGNNRGLGIEVFTDIGAIRSFLESKSRAASFGVNTTWVVQKYLESPLLFRGRKFDLRVWVICVDNGDVYIHSPGYVRTSSNAFTLESTERYIHLTNFCQQVNNESFAAFEEGNTLTWDDLVKYLDGLMWGCKSNGVWGQIRTIVRETFEALRGRGGSRTQGWEENGFARKPPQGITMPSKRGEAISMEAAPVSAAAIATGGGGGGQPASRHRFELLGYDFMIDSAFRVHFIEVNTNPSLTYQAGWHEAFVDAMMERTLGLVAAECWPEVFSDKRPPLVDAAALGDGTRPADGWQHVFNVYTAPLKHGGQAGPAAALAMAGLSRSAASTPIRPGPIAGGAGRPVGGKENGPGSPTKVGLHTNAVGRALQAAAAKLLSPGRVGGVAAGSKSAAPLVVPSTRPSSEIPGNASGAGEGSGVATDEESDNASKPRDSADESSPTAVQGAATLSAEGDTLGTGAGAGSVPALGTTGRSVSRGRPPVHAAAGVTGPLGGATTRATELRAAVARQQGQAPRNRVAAVARAKSVGHFSHAHIAVTTLAAVMGHLPAVEGAETSMGPERGSVWGGGLGAGAGRAHRSARSHSPAVHVDALFGVEGLGKLVMGISGTALVSPSAELT